MFLKLSKILRFAICIVFIFLIYTYWFISKNEIKNDKISLKPKNIPFKSLNNNFDFDFYYNASNKNTVNYNVHTFYYAWYGNLEIDEKWIHWNHKRLPHWNKELINDFSQDKHIPPEDIGADFYPALGLYSSNDFWLVRQHFKMIEYTGIGVIVLSWYAKNRSDPNGIPMDNLVPRFLDYAQKFNLKVALHIEPYEGRSVFSIKQELSYIFDNYANHSSYFKKIRHKGNKLLPVVFIYDSYIIPSSDWIKVLGKKGSRSIRDKPGDFFVTGLLLERGSCSDLSDSGFDAGYTYFASEQVSFSSNSDHWKDINRLCSLKNIEFYPSFGPGYKDLSVRPWNGLATQSRDNGEFYFKRFQHFQRSGARSFGVTSFNEWHEGTQIEPAIPHTNSEDRLPYDDYLPNSPVFYLELTRKFVSSFVSGFDVKIF